MLGCDARGVADPGAYNVNRIRRCKLGFPR